MALPSSGPISSSMVRQEMSQSKAVNYAFGEWSVGSWGSGSYYPTYGNYSYNIYTPINVYSPAGTYFSGSTIYTGVSMSNWYSYDRTVSLSLGSTGILDKIETLYCTPSTMLIFDAGTTNVTLSVNITGSFDNPYGNGPGLVMYYGKPWGEYGNSTGSATIITGSKLDWEISSGIITEASISFDYNYTYDSSKGRYLYFVLYCDNCYLA